MVKVILGDTGSGNTKQLVKCIREAVESNRGSLVCIEEGTDLRYDVDYRVRLISGSDYNMSSEGYLFLKGFIAGLHGGNFDITHVFIDSLYKLVGSDDDAQAEDFLNWCSEFGEKNFVSFTIAVSESPESAPYGIRKYC